jgi:hypothetical protein
LGRQDDLGGRRARFVVHESEGRLTLLGSAKLPGITVTVHDTFLLYKTVGLFRSERGRGLPRQMPRLERQRVVRAQAARLAEKLNRELE